MKSEKYKEMMIEDDRLIGKYNKYPDVACSARDTIHWCKIVAHCEQESSNDLIVNKKELSEKYHTFINVCDKILDHAV